MKQVFYTKRGTIEVCEVPTPMCSAGELLVANHWSLISAGTEMKSLAPTAEVRAARRKSLVQRGLEVLSEEGLPSLLQRMNDQGNLQGAPGYSAAGVVIEVGRDVAGFSVGDRVACGGAGMATHSEVARVTPMLAARVPDSLSLEHACWATVGAIALQGLRQASPGFGETVVVTGLGLLGLLVVQLARASGCRVVAVDLAHDRIDRARTLGAEVALDAANPAAVADAVRSLTGGIGADCVLLCATTSSNAPLQSAMELVRKKGRVVIVGDVGMALSRQPFYQKEVELTISCSYGPGRYDAIYEQGGIDYPAAWVRWTENRNIQAFVDAMAQGRVDVQALTTHRVPIQDAAHAYALLTDPNERALGVLLQYSAANGSPPMLARTTPLRGDRRPARPSPSGPIGVAMLGAGSFATSVHLPEVARARGARLRVVASRTGLSAAQAARRFGAERVSTDWREAIAASDVGAVIIATRHDTHAEMAEHALSLGKHVLVEKPLALTLEDIERVLDAQRRTGAVLLIGHNRRFSGAAKALRRILAERSGPAVLLYRVNAGAIPPDHWTQLRDVGGGRIIGEGSHFVDLMGYLIGDAVGLEAVQAQGIAPDGSRVSALDTYSATLRFGDGSLGTLLYSALGSKNLAKERLEASADGWSAVLDDFRELRGYGPGAPAWADKRQDKGFTAQMDAFLRAAAGDESAIPCLVSQARAARLAIQLDAALRASATSHGP